MVEATLIVKRKGKDEPERIGVRPFLALPRVGEGIELEVESKGILFRVIGVCHSGEGAGADIFAVEEGSTAAAILKVFGHTGTAKKFNYRRNQRG
jgi:hypothetical protein